LVLFGVGFPAFGYAVLGICAFLRPAPSPMRPSSIEIDSLFDWFCGQDCPWGAPSQPIRLSPLLFTCNMPEALYFLGNRASPRGRLTTTDASGTANAQFFAHLVGLEGNASCS